MRWTSVPSKGFKPIILSNWAASYVPLRPHGHWCRLDIGLRQSIEMIVEVGEAHLCALLYATQCIWWNYLLMCNRSSVPEDLHPYSNHTEATYYFPKEKELHSYRIIVCTLINSGRWARCRHKYFTGICRLELLYYSEVLSHIKSQMIPQLKSVKPIVDSQA